MCIINFYLLTCLLNNSLIHSSTDATAAADEMPADATTKSLHLTVNRMQLMSVFRQMSALVLTTT